MLRRPVAAISLAALSLVGIAAGGDAPDLSEHQYGLEHIGADAANEVATGKGIIVAVIDSGIDVDHPEFEGRIVSPLSWADCPDGVEVPCTDLRAVDDGDSHGTHVAGIIAAADDGVGITGVAPDALIMPIRVFNDDGDNVGDIAAGVHYALDNGADVINISAGIIYNLGLVLEAPVVHDIFSDQGAAFARAAAEGVVIAKSAGNAFGPACGGNEAYVDNALCVGADGELEASYSNWGVGIDIVAPGGGFVFDRGILSTVPLDLPDESDLAIGYGYKSGTSMAAPHVAGTLALLAELGITGDEARQRIIDTATVEVFDGVGGSVAFSGPGGTLGRHLDAAAAVGAR